MKKILVTNDDGITSDGLMRLIQVAKKFGKVSVIAPDGQRSAASHAITLTTGMDIYPYDTGIEGVKAYTCTGTPADCVRIGCNYILSEKPDVVLSGINYGYNTATDIQYSGTIGAAFEGVFQGCMSIALSEEAKECHEVADAYLEKVLDKLMEAPLTDGMIYNVNFPGCTLLKCKGILYDRKVSVGAFYRDGYKKIANLAHGGYTLMVEGEYNEDAEQGTDFRAVVDHYVSVGVVKNVG